MRQEKEQPFEDGLSGLTDEIRRFGSDSMQTRTFDDGHVCRQNGCNSSRYYIHNDPNSEVVIGEKRIVRACYCSCKGCSAVFMVPDRYQIEIGQKNEGC